MCTGIHRCIHTSTHSQKQTCNLTIEFLWLISWFRSSQFIMTLLFSWHLMKKMTQYERIHDIFTVLLNCLYAMFISISFPWEKICFKKVRQIYSLLCYVMLCISQSNYFITISYSNCCIVNHLPPSRLHPQSRECQVGLHKKAVLKWILRTYIAYYESYTYFTVNLYMLFNNDHYRHIALELCNCYNSTVTAVVMSVKHFTSENN